MQKVCTRFIISIAKRCFRLLNRRSQRKSFNLKQFRYMLKMHGVVERKSKVVNEGLQLSFLSNLS
jgi:hypothetical protein